MRILSLVLIATGCGATQVRPPEHVAVAPAPEVESEEESPLTWQWPDGLARRHRNGSRPLSTYIIVRAEGMICNIEFDPLATGGRIVGSTEERIQWQVGLPGLIAAHSAYRQEVRTRVQGGSLFVYRKEPYCWAAHQYRIESGEHVQSIYIPRDESIGCPEWTREHVDDER